MIDLVPLCTARLAIGERLDAGAGEHGHGLIAEIESATFVGERLSGRQAGNSSADWAAITPGGILIVDVRLAIRTDDDALLMMTYAGRLRRTDGEPWVAFVSANFQTGDARYTWLSEVQIVGKGEFTPDRRQLDYEFYEMR